MPKVYIVQEMMVKDKDNKTMKPMHRFGAGAKYGELVVVLPHSELGLQLDSTVSTIKEKLKDITEDDYLILVGNPIAMAIAATVAARKTGGKLKTLQWDKRYKLYVPLTADVGE